LAPSACWIKTNDVHGYDGKPLDVSNAQKCQYACAVRPSCVAFDWEPNNRKRKKCWILKSTETGRTTETELIFHYEINRVCSS